MSLIFLDVDGVLNDIHLTTVLWRPPGTQQSIRMPALRDACVQRLRTLVQRSGANLVLSSSWRMLPASIVYLVDHGVPDRFVGSTRILGARWMEIGEYMQLSQQPYVILDDETDFGPLAHRHVATDPLIGLTDADVESALQILAK